MVQEQTITIIKEENHRGNVASFNGTCLVIPTDDYSDSRIKEVDILKGLKLLHSIDNRINILEKNMVEMIGMMHGKNDLYALTTMADISPKLCLLKELKDFVRQ